MASRFAYLAQYASSFNRFLAFQLALFHRQISPLYLAFLDSNHTDLSLNLVIGADLLANCQIQEDKLEGHEVWQRQLEWTCRAIDSKELLHHRWPHHYRNRLLYFVYLSDYHIQQLMGRLPCHRHAKIALLWEPWQGPKLAAFVAQTFPPLCSPTSTVAFTIELGLVRSWQVPIFLVVWAKLSVSRKILTFAADRRKIWLARNRTESICCSLKKFRQPTIAAEVYPDLCLSNDEKGLSLEKELNHSNELCCLQIAIFMGVGLSNLTKICHTLLFPC